MDLPRPAPVAPKPPAASRACSNCARAKAKCVARLEDPDGKCDKCFRLGKECVFPSPSVRRRKATRRTRVAEMEAKIDGLVQLLSSRQPKPQAQLPPTPSSADAVWTAASSNSPVSQRSVPTLDSQAQVSKPHVVSEVLPDRDGSASSAPIAWTELGIQEANSLLDRFREMLRYFPYVVLPSSVTAQDLRRDRPFFYSCLTSVTAPTPSMRTFLGKDIMRVAGDSLLVKGEKSLDLLLGLTAYAAWYIHKCDFVGLMNIVLQLATALVYDLGLNRPKHATSNSQLFSDAIRNPDNFGKAFPDRIHDAGSHSLEDQRVFVGCFLLTSVISTYFQKLEPLRVTPHLEDCIRNLQENAEHRSDVVLATLARLQIIVQKTSQMHLPSTLSPMGSSTPIELYVKALQTQLQEIQAGMSQDVKQNILVQMHCHGVEMNIYDIGLSKSTFLPANSSSDFHQLDILHACLQAIKSFFEICFSLQADQIRCVSFMTFTHIANGLVILHKLSTFEFSGWDTNYVRQTVNFSDILLRLISWFESTRTTQGVSGQVIWEEDTALSRTSKKLMRVKEWHEQRIASVSEDPSVAQSFFEGDPAPSGDSFTFLNDSWLDELLGPWAFQPNATMA